MTADLLITMLLEEYSIKPSQGDGFKITTKHGYIDYRPDGDEHNEIWWVESKKRGHGSDLVNLMLKHHPAKEISWGATSSSGQAFREKWHKANPHVVDATEGERVPHDGQFDPFD
jgi:hypothetical protein